MVATGVDKLTVEVASMVADMVADMVTDMEVDMVAVIEVDMVVNMEVDMVADIVAGMVLSWNAPGVFRPGAHHPACASKLCKFIGTNRIYNSSTYLYEGGMPSQRHNVYC